MGAIVARAPLRVALGGGGTDLPSYYREHGGFVVSTAIDRHVHIVATTGFQRSYRLKHLEWEEVDDPTEVRHPILREALAHHWGGGPIELASVADAPPGTGLGSSGAYTVCAIKVLRLLAGRDLSPAELAEEAAHLEIDLLGRSIGKQDQYAASFGGARAYTFLPDDSVEVRQLDLNDEVRRALRDHFLLFSTGRERSASDVLAGQVAGDARVKRALHRLQELAHETTDALEAGDLDRFGDLMDEHWRRSAGGRPGPLRTRWTGCARAPSRRAPAA
jgi:D-glycero-alpha-D-manno-heptose-7-phosphate kinase